MSRKERCPKCFKPVVGLYIISVKPKRKNIRKAYFCNNCNFIVYNNQVCFKEITYKLKSE